MQKLITLIGKAELESYEGLYYTQLERVKWHKYVEQFLVAYEIVETPCGDTGSRYARFHEDMKAMVKKMTKKELLAVTMFADWFFRKHNEVYALRREVMYHVFNA